MIERPSVSDPGSALFDDVWFPTPGGNDKSQAVSVTLGELAQKAQAERWEDSETPSGTVPILHNYLRYTYAKLKQEGKILRFTDSDGIERGLFNTGLFTPNFEPLICLLESNRNPGKQPWVFKGWVTPSDWRLRGLAVDTLTPPTYFERADELVYNPDLELVTNLDHILDDREDRWPDVLSEDPIQRRLILMGAIQEVEKRARMNWRIAVPMFYWPKSASEGRIQLLLPLRLASDKPAHLALVIDRREGRYFGYTILTLSMAYMNARLITRPEADWITPFAT